jgi:hypothetical protein
MPFALKAMALFLLVRAVFVSLTHMAPSPIDPQKTVPFFNSIFYGSDLFFSGHTGMPLLAAFAMMSVPAAHGGVVLGILPLATADLLDGSQIRIDDSSALIRAAIELNGGGDRAKAMKILDDFDRLLDTYERSGGTHYGLYVLRAQSLALRGKTREAQAAIDTAWKKGWRMTWRLRHEPSMAGLTFPK